jgi:hypothetical protein
MRGEEIRQHVRAVPFRPLRVFLSDGSVHEVPHPVLALISIQHVMIAKNLRADGMPRDVVVCDPMHVTRIELATSNGGSGPPV